MGVIELGLMAIGSILALGLAIIIVRPYNKIASSIIIILVGIGLLFTVQDTTAYQEAMFPFILIIISIGLIDSVRSFKIGEEI